MTDTADAAITDEGESDAGSVEPTRRAGIDWARVSAYGLLPALALLLAMTAGYLKYVDNSVREDDVNGVQAVRAATLEIKCSLVDQTKVVTAASELARNLLIYGGGGEVRIEMLQEGMRRGVGVPETRMRFQTQQRGGTSWR